MSKITQIGKVNLDYTHYSGSDLYTDGAVEQDILNVVMNHPPADFPEIIEKSNDWSFLYHLSYLRHNIVEWLPIDKTHKVLEIGSGCGAITGILAEKAGEVVCIDLSETRSKINAYRHQEHDNIIIHIGNFADIEPDLPNDFDFILFIGVFEYCCLYITPPDVNNSNFDPYIEMLKIVRHHLSADGHLAIAIENRFGLKYWAGCTEDHLGTFFSGLEDYHTDNNRARLLFADEAAHSNNIAHKSQEERFGADNNRARTFTRPHFEKMLTSAGITDYNFYYPYPDYKFMTTLFSDTRLPLKGELYDNTRNFDRPRMELFNEKKVFDSIIADDLFPLFSNSYFIYTGKDTDTAYLRYSNDRAPSYRIRTGITKDKKVFKTPLTREAEAHIMQIIESYHLLLNQYKETGIAVNKCWLADDGKSAEFEYIEGKTLAEQLDECIKKEDKVLFNELIDRFTALTEINSTLLKDEELRSDSERVAAPHLLNHDLIFTNLMLDNNNQGKNLSNLKNWTLMDYEWMLDTEITPNETAYRALYCYLLEEGSRKVINPDVYYEKWGITPEDIETFRINERKFQDMVAGNRKSVLEMRAAFGVMSVDPKTLIEPYIKKAPARHVQVFIDSGRGFSEAESIHLSNAYLDESNVLVDITIPKGTRRLRLDPADMACVVSVHSLKWNGEERQIGRKYLKSNGKKINNNCYLFKTADPNFYLSLKGLNKQENNHLEIQMNVAMFSQFH
ncbi:MAG: class I SAM-dependent methyltransferase [Lachnospiraceae bacterium]|nr:class I SAM-dependent methyltransferase [Lachnospiraceae bacterium]